MNTEHARDHRRHALHTACIVRSSRDGRLLGDHTVDVSYSGLSVGAVDAPAVEGAWPGERVELSLQIPGSSMWIQGGGRIERVMRGRRAGDRGPALGIRVDRMDGLSRVLLTSVARHYPEATGSRSGQRDYAEAVLRIDRELTG
jgi:hypothetical protein